MAYLVPTQPAGGTARTTASPDLAASLVQGTAGVSTPLQSPATDANSDPLSTLVAMRNQAISQPKSSVSNGINGAGLLNPNVDFSQNGYTPGSGGGGGGGAAAPAAARLGGTAPGGNLAAWINQAERATSVDPTQWTNALNTIIQHESGGNPNAINNWDSNAQAGHPSQGLMQTIPGTFNQYVPAAMRGAGITDPVANIAAGIEYILSRYGGINNVPGIVAVNQGRPYVGY